MFFEKVSLVTGGFDPIHSGHISYFKRAKDLSNYLVVGLNTEEWLTVMKAAHHVGFQTTATIMYGHVDRSINWARHLRRVRDLQIETGGFTEFVPLPFVHMESPLYLKGKARRGPTFRESVLMHAVARIVLYPHIKNIQTSWVKMGHSGVVACLNIASLTGLETTKIS